MEEALIVGTENDINDIYSIHDHVALRCLHDMLSLCPHSDDTFTFFRPRSILIMKKMIQEVVAGNKIGELRNQLKFYRNDNSKPIFFFLYLARTTFLSIAKCHGECLSHNQHLCQHFNRGQDKVTMTQQDPSRLSGWLMFEVQGISWNPKFPSNNHKKGHVVTPVASRNHSWT